MAGETASRRPYTPAELTAAMEARRRVREGEARATRQRLNLTLEVVASMMGVSPSTVKRWEDARVMVPLNKADEYMALLDRLDSA